LSYKAGPLELLKLRRYAKDELQDKFSIRAFHDEVPGAGALPLDVLSRRIHAWVAQQKPTGTTGDSGGTGSPAQVGACPTSHARIPFTTLPAMPVNRASNPWNFTVKRLWSMPSKCSMVAWKSGTATAFSTAADVQPPQ